MVEFMRWAFVMAKFVFEDSIELIKYKYIEKCYKSSIILSFRSFIAILPLL